jgi:MFS family permease
VAARVSRTTGFVLIAYAFLVTMLGATLPTPLYPLFSQRYSLGELMVTVIFAAYAFGVIAGLLAFGELSDVIGRKPVLLAGLILSAVSALLFLFADSLVPIFAGRVISGLSAGLFTGTGTATLVDLVPGDRRRLASFVAVVVNLGGLGLGTLLAGLLADYCSRRCDSRSSSTSACSRPHSSECSSRRRASGGSDFACACSV